MANNLNPPAIIFINPNLSPSVLSQIQQQLYITLTMSAADFDLRIDGYADGYMDQNDGYGDGYISDGYYTDRERGEDQRVLVLRDLHDQTNRELADLVLCYRMGLLYVEKNKHGPPGKAVTLQNVYLLKLLVPDGLPRRRVFLNLRCNDGETFLSPEAALIYGEPNEFLGGYSAIGERNLL